MDPLVVVATWVHTIAFVIAWGWFGILGRIVLPGLDGALSPGTANATLGAIERRAVPILVLSIVLFIGTGTYLLVVDPAYRGLGNLTASTWTVLMAVKHVLVVGLVIVGVVVDRLIRRLERDQPVRAARSTRIRLGLLVEAATGLGAVIALLTVIAQAAP